MLTVTESDVWPHFEKGHKMSKVKELYNRVITWILTKEEGFLQNKNNDLMKKGYKYIFVKMDFVSFFMLSFSMKSFLSFQNFKNIHIL